MPPLRPALILLPLLASLAAGCATTQPPAATMQSPTPAAEPARVLRHVVLFKFKAESSSDDVRRIEEAFAALPQKIPVIRGFEWGTDVGVENKAQGFTHAFLVTFADEAGRDAYLPHPEHQAFVALLRPHLDKVLVVDYWARH